VEAVRGWSGEWRRGGFVQEYSQEEFLFWG